MTIYANHAYILRNLIKKGESQYKQFKDDHNPWASPEYYDKQMHYLQDQGYINFSKTSVIFITPEGKQRFEQDWRWNRGGR